MKRSNFSEAQVAFILCQVDEGATVGEVCSNAVISHSAFYVWRKICILAIIDTFTGSHPPWIAASLPRLTTLSKSLIGSARWRAIPYFHAGR